MDNLPPVPPQNPALPPPPITAQKKRGLGCWGCGCIILAILAVLSLGLVGGVGYLFYRGALELTSPTAAIIPTFDGGDDVYNGAEQKITAFNQNVQQSQPASLHLSADEINTLLARNPGLAGLNAHFFVTLTGDQADVQFSCPGKLTPFFFLKDRYLNGDAAIGLNVDPDSRALHVAFHSFTLGPQSFPDSQLGLVEAELNPMITAKLRDDPMLKLIMDHARNIEIKNGEFVVETN
jgi:hypothetical protein